MIEVLGVLFLGLVVAASSVFLGLGGGLIVVPLLPDLFGLSLQQAVATSVTVIFFMTLLNTVNFHRQKLVSWPVVLYMGPISALTAYFAAYYSRQADGKAILTFLLVILSIVWIRSFLQSFLKRDYQVAEEMSSGQKGAALLGGAFAGAASGFGGIGSGAVLAPLMIVLKIVAPEKLSPTSNGNMVFATFAAMVSFIQGGHWVQFGEWGLIRWDISLGVFCVGYVLSRGLRPYQDKLPFAYKSSILNMLLFLLIIRISMKLFHLN